MVTTVVEASLGRAQPFHLAAPPYDLPPCGDCQVAAHLSNARQRKQLISGQGIKGILPVDQGIRKISGLEN